MPKPNPTHSRWAPIWETASQCEIGVRIGLDSAITNTLQTEIHRSRPPGFDDYTLSTPSEPNCLYITKPGVTLD